MSRYRSKFQSPITPLQILQPCSSICVDSTSNTLYAHSTNRATSNVLNSRDRETLLIIVSSRDSATERTALEGGSDDVLALDTKDVETMAYPVCRNIAQNDAEADQWDNVGDTGVCCVSNSALNWREDGATCVVMSVAESKNKVKGSQEIAYLKHP